jgi:hypothetical protein
MNNINSTRQAKSHIASVWLPFPTWNDTEHVAECTTVRCASRPQHLIVDLVRSCEVFPTTRRCESVYYIVPHRTVLGITWEGPYIDAHSQPCDVANLYIPPHYNVKAQYNVKARFRRCPPDHSSHSITCSWRIIRRRRLRVSLPKIKDKQKR